MKANVEATLKSGMAKLTLQWQNMLDLFYVIFSDTPERFGSPN